MPIRLPQQLLRSRALVVVASAAFVGCGLLVLRSGGLLEPLELGAYDLLLRSRPHVSAPRAPIALVRITEADIRRFGHPLCDDLLALALERLLAANPRAIGVDLYRDVPVSSCPPGAVAAAAGPPRQDLAHVVGSGERIVMIMKFPDEHNIGTGRPYFLRDNSHVGFSDLTVDPGGTTRRGLLFSGAATSPTCRSRSSLLCASCKPRESPSPPTPATRTWFGSVRG